MYMIILTIASIFIWIAVSHELSKSPKKQNNRKIIILTSLGTLSTLVLTISFIQNHPF